MARIPTDEELAAEWERAQRPQTCDADVAEIRRMERDLESMRAKLAAKIEVTKNRHKVELRQLETRHAKELGTFRADCVPEGRGKQVVAVERQITQALAVTQGARRRATKKPTTKKATKKATKHVNAKKQAKQTAAKKAAKKVRATSSTTQGSTAASTVQAAVTTTKTAKRSTGKKVRERETASAQPVPEQKASEPATSAPPPCHPCDEASPPATAPTTRRPRAPRKKSMSKANGNGSGSSPRGKPRQGDKPATGPQNGESHEDDKARKMQHLGSLATKATDDLLKKLGVSPPAAAEPMPRRRRY